MICSKLGTLKINKDKINKLKDGNQYYFYTTGEMATGWVKDGDNWCYCENSGERRYSDLKTYVFTFKIDKKTGICSNFTDNKTRTEQAAC